MALNKKDDVVVVRIFNATRHPRHLEAVAIVMYMYLYSLAFMDHPCTLGAIVCHQAPPCPLYTQTRARRVWARCTNGLKIVSTLVGFEPTISRMKVECTNHLSHPAHTKKKKKRDDQINIFLISSQKHLLWVLIRNASARHMFSWRNKKKNITILWLTILLTFSGKLGMSFQVT